MAATEASVRQERSQWTPKLLVGLALLLALALAPAAHAASPAPAAGEYRAAGIDVKKKTIRYGPFMVAPSEGHGHGGHGHGGGHNVPLRDLAKPCRKCSLVGATFDLVHADGSSANFDTGAMLHHVVMFNQARRDATCGRWAQRFLAAGNERTPFMLPAGYGYPVRARHRWTLVTHLMNMTEEHMPLWVSVDYYYAKPAVKLLPVRPFWLDVANCTDSEYTIPPGRSVEKWSISVDGGLAGKVLAMAGHLHDDGVRITARRKRGSSSQHVCTSRAGYDQDPAYKGHIESMTGCLGDPLTRLRRGDRLRLKSVYDSPTVQHDVMGIMLGYLRPSGGR